MRMKRNTLQKQIVMHALKEMYNHPTASQVYEHVHKDYPSISKATVFRILNSACEDQEIMKIMSQDKEVHYEMMNPPHYHMRCRRCGKIQDAPLLYQAQFDEMQKKFGDFQVEGHSIEFYGLCNECLKKEREEHQNE